MPETSTPTDRRPFHGSCHCGKIRYIAFVTFPPTTGMNINRRNVQRFYKCNCSTCHKMGIFHMRLPNPARDFVLLSPTDPSAELSKYHCFKEILDWYFCQNCGVRCFSVAKGSGINDEIDLEEKLGQPSEGKKTKIWRMTEEKTGPGPKGYLSVNAHTIDQDQEGFDLREIVNKNWLEYLDCKNGMSQEYRYDSPYSGGTW